MNIGLYIRLSKEDNIESESKSITSQKSYLREYIKIFDYNKVFEYIDDGYSGTNFNRPGFKKMLDDIENKKIDVVITKDSSRLGRNISWVTYYIEEYFPRKKIRYISIDDNYDSNKFETNNNDLLIFKNLFNEYYCKDISKKIKSSLKTRKIEGKYTGWKAPYGYQKSKEDYHKLVIDKKVKDNVLLIFKLALKNNSPSHIAKILNDKNIFSPAKYINKSNSKWTSKTIKDILQNPIYIGDMAQGKRKKLNYKLKQSIQVPKEDWIIKENTHEPIIEKKDFEKIQKLLLKYKNIKKNKYEENEFINIIYCKECGSKIGINKNTYCVCNNYKKNYKDRKCSPHTLNYKKVKEYIKKEIEEDIIKELLPQKSINNLINDKLLLEKQILNSKDENEIRKLHKDLNSKIELIKLICKIKNTKKIYLDLINKIYLSEDGTIELHLNYNH